MLVNFCCSLHIPMTINIQKPAVERYKTRSAITKPTRKKRLDAGRKGTISSASAIVSCLQRKPIIG